jgi:16S rRNA (guanine(966)-N(2))-methyltransferase RsmD
MPKSAPLKHQVRIIAGQYRRRLLPVVDAPESAGLRPTPDRVRQTVFNWLEHFLGNWDGIKAMDCFAGTGALGLEAASRGAASVLLCEQFPPAVSNLKTVIATLDATHCTVRQGDALAQLAGLAPASLNLIFLDPPFNAGWMPKLHAPVARALAAGGLVYAESEAALEWEGFEVLRHMKAGAVHAQLMRHRRDE